MHIPAHLVDESQLSLALAERLISYPGMLPMPVVDWNLFGHISEVVSWVGQRLSSEFQPAEEIVVAGSKPGHGVRPIAIWDLPSTLVYSALAGQIASELGVTSRESADWESFQRAPLKALGEYIVSADISAFYQYIDHALLAQELLARGADSDVVKTLISLLYETSGKAYGLPQQSTASDILAEVFVQRLHRALVRRGFKVWRYNDDFRISCSTWPEVVRQIEILSDEARQLGLVLNDSKLLTWTRGRYEEHLEESARLLKSIVDEAELDTASYMLGPYEDEESDGSKVDPTDVQIRAGLRILQQWHSIAGDGRVRDENRSTYGAVMRLMSGALRSLTAGGRETDDAIEIAVQVLNYEQTLTPRVCAFLDSRDGRDVVLSAFSELLENGSYLNDWQAMWIVNSIGRWPTFDDGEAGTRRAWLTSLSDEHVNVLTRGFALLAMSQFKLRTIADLMKVYDRTTSIVQPLIVAAIGVLNPDSELRDALAGDSELNRLAIDAAKA